MLNNGEKIIKSVTTLGIPCFLGHYKGDSIPYATYETILERNEEFADNESECEGAYLRLHVFTKENFLMMKEKIKEGLKEQGFFGITYGPETYEDDTELYHLIFDFIAEE